MKLSSLDIRKQQFSRIVRGYDRDEVDAFLDMVSTQWQELVDENRRNTEKIGEMNVKLEHYHKVEEALEEAIKSARDGAEQKIKDAEKSATAVLEKAEARAVKITIGAEAERLKIKRETARYSIRQKEMLTKFRSFLTSELEMLAYHEKNDILRVPGLEMIEREESETDSSDLDIAADVPAPSSNAPKPSKSQKKGAKKGASETSTDDGTDISESTESEITTTSGTDEPAHEASKQATDASSEAPDEHVEDLDQKPTWTVNTLVSPDSETDTSNQKKTTEPDRPATRPNGDMRAAQEEIENLRKLLRDLE